MSKERRSSGSSERLIYGEWRTYLLSSSLRAAVVTTTDCYEHPDRRPSTDVEGYRACDAANAGRASPRSTYASSPGQSVRSSYECAPLRMLRRHMMSATVRSSPSSHGPGASLVSAYRDRGYAVLAASRTVGPSGDPSFPRAETHWTLETRCDTNAGLETAREGRSRSSRQARVRRASQTRRADRCSGR
jgi:hypothetical protein